MVCPDMESPDGTSLPPADVYAGGAVCWRLHKGELQVLLIHRPRYDDWSWPKGKSHKGELSPTTAVREVAEETGFVVSLGVPLPSSRYPLSDGRVKEVAMWAAHIRSKTERTKTSPDEVDKMEWLPARAAHGRLTRRADRVQLDVLLELHEKGRLHTFPAVLLRAAYSYPTRSWKGKKNNRPLVNAGKYQAQHLATILQAWKPRRVYSSPLERGEATVRQYVQAVDVSLRTKRRLSPERFMSSPSKTSALVTKTLTQGRSSLLCLHAEAAHSVSTLIEDHFDFAGSHHFSGKADSLEPGELLVLHVSKSSGVIVATERHIAPTTAL